MYRLIIIILVFCVQSLILSGCGLFNPHNNSAIPNQLVTSVLSDPKTFNAILSKESPNIFSLTYEGLVSENPITGEVEPKLAKSWEISEDGLEIVFTLRDNLKWSDGEAITADDVVFTYNDLVFNDDIPSNSKDGFRIGVKKELPKVEKVNEKQVKFTVPEPFAPFLKSTSLEILPEHILRPTLEEKDGEGKPKLLSTWGIDTPAEKIIVNGAYQLENYTTSQRIIFKKNPYYWQKDNEGNTLPYIDRVIWQIVENTETSLLQFRSGSLDGIGITPDYFSLLKREENRGNFTIYNGGPAYGTTFISFNLNTGKRNGKPLIAPYKSRWFNNVNFRKAVAYGLDRQRMINNIFRGLGEAQNSFVSVQSPYYDQSLKGYDYNPEKAKELLLKEGFYYDDKGQLFDADGNEVSFNFITNAGNRIREALGSQIKQDLGKIGMKINFNPVAFNLLVDKLDNSLDWDCHLIGLTGGNEPHGGANVWFTEGELHLFNQGKSDLTDRQGRGKIIFPKPLSQAGCFQSQIL
jgi:peptide/nickel transport system substrate-binding protein